MPDLRDGDDDDGSVTAMRRSRLSMAQVLSLVTLTVVIIVLGTAMGVVWYTLTHSAVAMVEDHLNRAVTQLAATTAAGLRDAQARYAQIARDPAVGRALANFNPAAPATGDRGQSADVVVVLSRLQAPSDSGLRIELWNASGQRVTVVGEDPSDSILLAPPDEGRAPPLRRPGLDSIRPIDSLQVGALYRRSEHVYFWLVMPIVREGKPVGYLAHERRIAVNPQTEETIRELSGDSAVGYYHNVDGSIWTTFGGVAAEPPTKVDDSPATFEREPLGELIRAEARVPGTQLVLTMEVPRRHVVAGALGTVRRLALFSILLAIVAAAIAWWAGQRIARPLIRLNDATESVARGDYATRVDVAGPEEIARLATTFNTMAEQVGQSRATSRAAQEAAETANRAKSDFLAAMSHELRTPLNAIGGYAELMEMGLRGPITEDQKKDLARIRNSQQHLLGLIGRVLDLNRIERGEVAYEHSHIAVDPLLLGLEDLVLPQASAKQQTLEYKPDEPNLVVIADREKLRQIVINLLSNAIRYSPTGSSITIAARRKNPSLVQIEVADSGPGIPPERQQQIFEPFVQLDRSFKSGIEGVGLGLAISRDLARGMGGDLTVDSRPGHGATFTLTLPAGIHDGNTQMSRTAETSAVSAATKLKKDGKRPS